MPKSKRKGRLYKIDLFGSLTARNFLDWILTIVLTLLVALAIVQLGATRPAPRAVVAVLCGVLLLLHGVWLLVNRETPLRFHRPLLLFLPFLGYAGLHWAFLSPAPWEAHGQFMLYFQAFAVAWVAAHNLRTRAHLWLFFSAVGVVCGASLLLGLRQGLDQPGWVGLGPLMPMGVRLHEVFDGRATGTLSHPVSFAGLTLVGFFVFALVAGQRKLGFSMRLLCALLALLMVGALLLTGDLFAPGVLGVVLLSVPFIVSRERGRRLAGVLGALVLVGAAYGIALGLVVPDLPSLPLTPGPEIAGLPTGGWGSLSALVQANPVLGSGAGAFEYAMEPLRTDGATDRFSLASSAYLTVQAELGIVGLILLLGPGLWLVVRGFRGLGRLPERESAGDEMVRRGRRKRGVVPTERYFLVMCLCALVALGLHMLVAWHLQVPGLLLLMAALLGLTVKLTPAKPLLFNPVGPRAVFCLSPAVLLFVLLAGVEAPRLLDAERALRAREGIDFITSPDFAYPEEEARLIRYVTETLEASCEALPDDPGIWADSGFIRVVGHGLPGVRPRELGEEVVARADAAIARLDGFYYYYVVRGLGHWLRGDYTAAEADLRAGRALSPQSSLPAYYLAELLKFDPATVAEARALLNTIAERDPDFPRIEERVSLLSLRRGTPVAGLRLPSVEATGQLPPLAFLPPLAHRPYGRNLGLRLEMRMAELEKAGEAEGEGVQEAK